MAYIGNSPGTATQRIVDIFTATAGQTVFTPSNGYFLGYVDVIINGSDLINGVDYTADNGTTITLTEAATLNDSVKIVTFIPRGLTDGYLKSEADALFLSADETATLTNKTLGSNTVISSEITNTATSSLQVPAGTTAQRPTGADGKVRYNTDLDKYEGYNGSSWLSLGGGATGGGADEIFHLNGQTITVDYSMPEGQNAISAGPITVADNVIVTIPTDSCWTVFGR
jgi:hypothetical protein